MACPTELLIQSERVICSASKQDGPACIAVANGKIVDVSPAPPETNLPRLRFLDALVLPGLVDVHAHPACQGSVWGIDPDEHMLPGGVTTVMSQGDAGADNWQDYQRHTIRRSQTRVLMAMNPSAIGESTSSGCFERLDDVDVERCIAAIADGGEHVPAVSVNVSRACCGDSDPREILQRGLQVAGETKLPLLYGMRPAEEWSFEEQMSLLRPGDLVTYCFRSEPHNIMVGARVHPAIRAAQQRGILFDVTDGATTLDFEVARTAIADDFLPDTISTDLHRKQLADGKTHSLPHTMSKLRAAGMEVADVFAAVTSRPAAILQRPEPLGSLEPGAPADLVALQTSAEPVTLSDVYGNQLQGFQWVPVCTVRNGRVVYLSDDARVDQQPAG